jgi:soluble lytic murein transglycosylase-like protein
MDLAPLISQVANLYNLRLDILTAQIQIESSGDPFAFRYEDAYFEKYIRDNPGAKGFRYGPLAACSFGLLQIVFETALEHGFVGQPWELFSPRVGLSRGADYFKHCLLQESGSYPAALRRYNGSGKSADAYATKVLTLAGSPNV